MKMGELQKRLRRDRPMTSVTIRMPEDVVDDLKRVAPLAGFSGYQPLIRYYVGQGLREDLARLEAAPVDRLIARLREAGVPAETIRAAMGDATKVRGKPGRRKSGKSAA